MSLFLCIYDLSFFNVPFCIISLLYFYYSFSAYSYISFTLPLHVLSLLHFCHTSSACIISLTFLSLFLCIISRLLHDVNFISGTLPPHVGNCTKLARMLSIIYFSFIYLFIHLFIYLFIYLFIHLFIYLFIYLFI